MTAAILVPTNMPKTLLTAMLAITTPKLMVATNTFVPDQDTLDYANDVTNEGAGTGYTSPGITLTGGAITIDGATNKATLSFANVAPVGLSVPCRWGIIHLYTGTLATSPVLAYADLAEGVSGNITFTALNWNASGIVPFVMA